MPDGCPVCVKGATCDGGRAFCLFHGPITLVTDFTPIHRGRWVWHQCRNLSVLSWSPDAFPDVPCLWFVNDPLCSRLPVCVRWVVTSPCRSPGREEKKNSLSSPGTSPLPFPPRRVATIKDVQRKC